MAVGLQPTKEQIDTTIGDISRAFFYQFRRAKNFKYYLDGVSDGDLTTLGYSAGDIANLRSAAGVLDTIRQVWEGTAAISPATDQRTFPRRVAGMGDV